jgi:glutamyl/glutaminyl-tRNA synthetase
MPQFGHVSLILAPDRSKLSKRHGATSVGQVFLKLLALSMLKQH